MSNTFILELISALPEISRHHSPEAEIYKLLSDVLKQYVKHNFSSEKFVLNDFGPFGTVGFPFHYMGNINTLDIMNLDELIIFSYYWVNRHRYRRVADLGANLGLHSIILAKCGFEVKAYEPDSQHYEILSKNIAANGCSGVELYNAAISTNTGKAEFIRVLGNTTSSHLKGSKSNPYGELLTFEVPTVDFASVIQWADLIKCDIEGHEKEILLTTQAEDWARTDALVEVESKDSAQAIFNHFISIGISLFAQKINWSKVERLEDMPTSYHDGTLFISTKAVMPWV